MQYNKLLHGKDTTENIVSIEVKDDVAELFIENESGITSKTVKNRFWLLANRPYDEYEDWIRLDGDLHYKYGIQFLTHQEFLEARDTLRHRDTYSVFDPKESLMVKDGYTQFKGMKLKDVSVLSFDIESTGLEHNEDSKVLLISNTYRKGDTIVKKLFAYDEYSSDADFFDAWCDWVRSCDPTVILGHNIFSYDLPYMAYCCNNAGATLRLGRDGSDVRFDDYVSRKRKDQTQDIHFKRCFIYGREVIDTLFLAINYDIATKKYESYGLKNIIRQEGLEKKDRVFYDSQKIRYNYKYPAEWEKIKVYCQDDSDDALALYDLMAPPFFYMTQNIPKPYQAVGYSASGSQINSIMCRSYLQEAHSLPKRSDAEDFEGAISIGNPGIYSNVFKIDVASLYPSIMIQYEIYDKAKDPKAYFKELVSTFTTLRLEYKKLAKQDKYYDDLQSAYKIFINSCYGFLGASGLNFNSPVNAALVTSTGRDILTKALDWSKANNFVLVNADTDSVSISRPNGEDFASEADKILQEVNSLFPPKIRFEHDGFYKKIIVIKAKNYILWDGKKLKYKGSAIKASTKEPALKEFIQRIIQSMLDDDGAYKYIYTDYVKEIFDIKDMKRWVTRKTITDKVLNAKRTNEQKVLDAIKNSEYTEGDRVYLYFKEDDTLGLVEHFDGNYSKDKLLEKLFKTARTFDTVLDMDMFPNLKLKKNKELLSDLSGVS